MESSKELAGYESKIDQNKTSEAVIFMVTEQRKTQEFLIRRINTVSPDCNAIQNGPDKTVISETFGFLDVLASQAHTRKTLRHCDRKRPNAASRSLTVFSEKGQANKSAGWMPWH